MHFYRIIKKSPSTVERVYDKSFYAIPYKSYFHIKYCNTHK